MHAARAVCGCGRELECPLRTPEKQLELCEVVTQTRRADGATKTQRQRERLRIRPPCFLEASPSHGDECTRFGGRRIATRLEQVALATDGHRRRVCRFGFVEATRIDETEGEQTDRGNAVRGIFAFRRQRDGPLGRLDLLRSLP